MLYVDRHNLMDHFLCGVLWFIIPEELAKPFSGRNKKLPLVFVLHGWLRNPTLNIDDKHAFSCTVRTKTSRANLYSSCQIIYQQSLCWQLSHQIMFIQSTKVDIISHLIKLALLLPGIYNWNPWCTSASPHVYDSDLPFFFWQWDQSLVY